MSSKANRPFSNDKSIVEVCGKNLGETEAAVRGNFGNVTCWVPKSQMEDWPDRGQYGDFLMNDWIATEKGII